MILDTKKLDELAKSSEGVKLTVVRINYIKTPPYCPSYYESAQVEFRVKKYETLADPAFYRISSYEKGTRTGITAISHDGTLLGQSSAVLRASAKELNLLAKDNGNE